MQYAPSVQNITSLTGFSDSILGSNVVFTYKSESSIFFPGEIITVSGHTSDSTATVVSDDGAGNLIVKNISNLIHPFSPGIVITGENSGSTTTIFSITNSFPNLNPIDANNYFTKEIRWSFDALTWTNWFPLNVTFGTILTYSTETGGPFLPGETITLSTYTGDTTATVISDDGAGNLIVNNIVNGAHPFAPGLAIIGQTSGATTTIGTIINSFPNPNTNLNCWIHVRYTWNTSLTSPGTAILEDVYINGTRTVNPILQPVTIQNGGTGVYTNQDTYKVFNVQDFYVFTVNNTPTTGVDMQFRYTQSQGRHWSPWYRLTSDNLKSIQFDPIRFCNFQFGFANNSGSDFNLYDLELTGEFQNVTAAYATIAKLGLKTQCDPTLTQQLPLGPCDSGCTTVTTTSNVIYGCDGKTCCTACSSSDQSPWNIVTGDVCTPNDATNTDKLWKKNTRAAYGKLPELKSYLDGILSARDGWNVTYGLADPDGKGIDPILHEQQLHNIISMQDIQIIVPGNKFPNEDITLSGLDLDLIQTFEVHIVKDQFKNTFGVEFRPGTKDIIYFCDRNQMWEVDQMIPSRTAFNTETFWRVILRKYNNRASRQFVNQPDKDFVDALTKNTTLEELFGVAQDNEYKKTSKNEDILLPNTAQQYNDKSMINIVQSVGAEVIYVTNNRIWNASLTVSMSQYQLPLTSRGQKLVTYNPFDMSMSKSDNRAISMWFMSQDFKNTWEYSLFNNFDYTLNVGYKLSLYNGALIFTLNGNTWSLPLNNSILPNVWYIMLVNLNQQQDELEMIVYQRQSEDGQTLSDSKLVQVSKMIWQISPDSFSQTQAPFIGGCDLHTTNTSGDTNSWFLTNIRVYKQQLPKSKRNIVLNEKTVSDSHLMLLVDDATQFILPDYGNI